MKATTCKSCRAPVFFAINETSGKREPIDLEAREDGNIEVVGKTRRVLDDDSVDETPVVRHLKKGEVDTLPGFDIPDRYVSHFATCPDADRHRRR